MKTEKEIAQEIKDIQKYHEHLGMSEFTTQSKRDGKKVSMLTKCLYFLQTNPTKDFVAAQKKLLKDRIDIINGGYSVWYNNTPEAKAMTNEGKDPKGKYNTIMELSKWKEELKFVSYILD